MHPSAPHCDVMDNILAALWCHIYKTMKPFYWIRKSYHSWIYVIGSHMFNKALYCTLSKQKEKKRKREKSMTKIVQKIQSTLWLKNDEHLQLKEFSPWVNTSCMLVKVCFASVSIYKYTLMLISRNVLTNNFERFLFFLPYIYIYM